MGQPASCILPVQKQYVCVIPGLVCFPGSVIPCCRATQCVWVCPLSTPRSLLLKSLGTTCA